MRILLVPSSYLPALGGVEVTCRNLAKEFSRRGHEVRIVTNRSHRSFRRREILDGVEVHRFFFLDRLPPRRPLAVLKFLVLLFFLPATLLGTFRILSQFRPEVVNLQFLGAPAPYLYLLSFLFHFRLVATLQGEDVESDPRASSFRKWLFRKILGRTNLVTANSRYLLSEAVELAPAIREKSIVIPNGVDPAECAGVEPYRHPRRYLFAAGRFVQKKGFDVLVEAFAVLEDPVDLIVAGDGEELPGCRRLASRLGVSARVIFWGPADRRTMCRLMSACELLIVPSRREPFGIICLEGLVAGKPVVAARVGGIPEIVSDGRFGVLFYPVEPRALAAAIRQALDRRGRVAADPAQVIATYAWGRIAERYLERFS